MSAAVIFLPRSRALACEQVLRARVARVPSQQPRLADALTAARASMALGTSAAHALRVAFAALRV